MALAYVATPFVGIRRPTREVQVGSVGIGAANPIRVQSMTTADTCNTAATVDEIERLADVGCEIVRVTVPSIRDSENLKAIRSELSRRHVRVPLVADIHYTPNAAMIAARWVEKVRVNPGNYADKKKFDIREYSDTEYAAEVERVAERFRPLVLRCMELGVALRIGTNHGSLSDRVMNRYGDTPRGMVESALEFLDVCEAEGFRETVFSMKSSNPQVAIQAYRLLAARLYERSAGEASYPFHVGVTEAGDGEDGRIKSAIGIGALLEDGIGDTVRVSLTEDPVREVPVARALARRAEARWAEDRGEHTRELGTSFVDDAYTHARRPTRKLGSGEYAFGAGEPVRVEIDLGPLPEDADSVAAKLATSLVLFPDLPCEGLLVSADASALKRVPHFVALLARVGISVPLAVRTAPNLAGSVPTGVSRVVLGVEFGTESAELIEAVARLARSGHDLEWCLGGSVEEIPQLVDRVLEASAALHRPFALSVVSARPIHAARAMVARLRAGGAGDLPIVLRHRRAVEGEEASLAAAIDLGALLCDGLGDMVSLAGFDDPTRCLDLAYRVLQGARLRTTRTEYISCPSCGRTLFDLEETTAEIKSKTDHLKGVKIAVMGCIVNGPGEMADADFGYVGSGPGRVTLYVGKEIVARNVPQEKASDRLVELIREHGRWAEPG